MKGVGLCLLIMAGGLVGCMRATALRERVRALGVMCRFVDWLSREIRYTAAPLDVLLRRATAEFYDWSLLEDVEGFEQWRKSLSIRVKRIGFTDEDAVHVCRFAEELGNFDVAGQLAHGAFYAVLFEERRQQARQEAEKRGRLELMLWTGGAAVLALLWM